MKHHRIIAFLFLTTCGIVCGQQNNTSRSITQQRHNDILSLQDFSDVSFQPVNTAASLISKGCVDNVVKPIGNVIKSIEDVVTPIGNGIITGAQWSAAFIFAYKVACLIDPKPYN